MTGENCKLISDRWLLQVIYDRLKLQSYIWQVEENIWQVGPAKLYLTGGSYLSDMWHLQVKSNRWKLQSYIWQVTANIWQVASAGDIWQVKTSSSTNIYLGTVIVNTNRIQVKTAKSYLTGGICSWYLTGENCKVISDRWHLTCGIWQVAGVGWLNTDGPFWRHWLICYLIYSC